VAETVSLPYYRWFPGDYIRDTRRLTMLQHGAYRLLIDEYMVAARPLPNDLPALYRICGAVSGEEQVAVRYALEEFFVLSGPVWRHKRCDEELEHQDARSKSAKDSATRRWAGANADANVMRTHSVGNAIQNQNQNQKEKEKRRGASRPLLPDWLSEDVWSDWHQYRNARKGWTPKARELSLGTLADLRDAGHDPRAVVNQSIERGWTGLFPVKQSDDAAVDSFVARIRAQEGAK